MAGSPANRGPAGYRPVSVQLFSQEQIDLREEDPEWINGKVESGFWNSPIAHLPWNSMPWYALEKRGIPPLEEKFIFPQRILGIKKGKSENKETFVRDIARPLKREGLTHEPIDSQNSKTLRVASTRRGGYTRYLIDFGKTVVGSLVLEIQGAKGGEIIDTLHAETIDEKKLELHYFPDNNSRVALSHRMICREGVNRHTFYHAFGFRYMTLTVRGNRSELALQISLRTALYPLKRKGSFETSDVKLNRIWEACAWTQQVCSLDAFVDTPWREQVQWGGDARVQSWNTTHLSGGTDLLRRGIAQLAAQRVPNGLTYGHAPTMAHHCILPDFSLIWILTLWDFYWQTESLEPLQTHQETVDGILNYYEAQTDSKTGLVAYDSRYWLFLDWTEIQREGHPTLLNLWLLIALEKLGVLYRKSGDRKRARAVGIKAASLRSALEKLIHSNGRICDGLMPSGKKSTEYSIHSQVLALTAGGFDKLSQKAIVEGVLLPFILETKEFKAKPSAYWCTYIFTVLRELGYGKEVVKFIGKHWGPMADYGTTWENFSPIVAEDSFSHAWSAHPLFHLIQNMGGIVQSSPGWKSIDFSPQFSTEYGSASIPTPLGIISVRWKTEKGVCNYYLRVPKNMKVNHGLGRNQRKYSSHHGDTETQSF